MHLSKGHWEFPLPRTHTGMLLGNATMGLMIWGQDNLLKITIGRADLWDHRGGMTWKAHQNFADIRRLLEANDEKGLRALFVTDTANQPGQPGRPSIIPVGRVDLELATDVKLKTGSLDMATGIATITCQHQGCEKHITLLLGMQDNIAAIVFDDPTMFNRCINMPAYVTTGDQMKNISFTEPTTINDPTFGGFIQPFPNDPGIAVGYQMTGKTLWMVTTRNDSVQAMQMDTQRALLDAIAKGLDTLENKNKTWWDNYWQDVPQLDIPNPKLQFLYDYGMYKFAGSSQPDGIACTLQGPWIEDYTLPPWSSDYHFNINVQMCYWPAFKGNRLSHLKPLFDLIFSWEDTLRQNAKYFVGIDDGIMMPHAVDDRCVCMGGFWTGCIDHACSAWMAMMMFDYVRYTGDMAYLREKVYPFMVGTMRVYDAMLEKIDGQYSLPVSVSPEYRGAEMNAWGRDASFQLAAIHRLIEDIQAAAGMLDIETDARWADIQQNLPRITTYDLNGRPIIAHWEGVYLEESHRHHSHLGAISPFDSIDVDDEQWRTIVRNTLDHWVAKGMGLWSGWCVPWASMIHSRMHNGTAAQLLLEIWERIFTNQGHGTLHDINECCISVMGGSFHGKGNRKEIMQLDAGFGAVAAIVEMLLHTRRGVLQIMAGVPNDWKSCGFGPMPTEFGVLVSATRRDGRVDQITLKAQRDTVVKIANPWSGDVCLTDTKGNARTLSDRVLTLNMKQDDQWVLRSMV